MKNILLLGGNGFLGRNLAKGLSESESFKVFVYDIIKPVQIIERVTYYEGSIEDYQLISRIMQENQINILVHMVSTIVPGSTIEQYINNCKLVQLSTIPLMDYCATNNVELVFLSSGGTVYGVKGGVVSENEPTAPISYYGLSKVQIEDLINFYHRRYKLNYLILRPSNPYGYGQNLYGRQGLIAVILGKLLRKEHLTVFGDGSVVRDYIYIDDFVYYVKELLRKNILNETINIGSGEGCSINQIIDIVREVADFDLNVDYIEARKDDVPKLVLDTTRLHNFVNRDNVGIKEGVKRFYADIVRENECIKCNKI
jgi:UDP-glucose 4-epimerase